MNLTALLYLIFGLFITWIALYDLRYKLVSPIVVILGLIIVVPIQFLLNKISFTLLGLLVGLIVSGLVYSLKFISKKEYFGFGDVWVCLLIGAVLGWKTFIVIFIGSFYIEVLISIILILFKKVHLNDEIPFVPMLALSIGINALSNNFYVNFISCQLSKLF